MVSLVGGGVSKSLLSLIHDAVHHTPCSLDHGRVRFFFFQVVRFRIWQHSAGTRHVTAPAPPSSYRPFPHLSICGVSVTGTLLLLFFFLLNAWLPCGASICPPEPSLPVLKQAAASTQCSQHGPVCPAVGGGGSVRVPPSSSLQKMLMLRCANVFQSELLLSSFPFLLVVRLNDA